MNDRKRLYVLLGVLGASAIAAAIYWSTGNRLDKPVVPLRSKVSTNLIGTWCCTETGFTQDGPVGRGPKKNPNTGKDTMYSSFLATAPDGSSWRVFTNYSEDETELEQMMACPADKHPDGKWLPYRNPDGTLLGLRTPDGKLLQPAEAPRYRQDTPAP